MKKTMADVFIDILYNWGVRVIFGIPGDGINGIMEALRKRESQIKFIQVRHEEAAAFAACAYAKFTGYLGVCLATKGPGAIHLLNGLYDAKLDNQPVLAITGNHYHDLMNTFGQQDLPLDNLFNDVASYNTMIMGAEHIENVTNIACRTALGKKSVSHINFPEDFQSVEYHFNGSKRNIEHHVSDMYVINRPLPPESEIRKAADILNSGSKVAILAGQGALGATNELEMIADILGAPIIKALLGKGVVPDDSPYTTGGIGYLGTAPSQEAMQGCDTLLIAGSAFPYVEFYPKPGSVRAVQIDLNPAKIGIRYPVELGLVGDCKRTINELIPLLDKKSHSFLRKAQDNMKKWKHTLHERSHVESIPIKPQYVTRELSERLEYNAIVTADSGTNTTWWARHIMAERGQKFSVSGTLASMGCAVPYAIAAQIAYPDRQVIAFAGDGGFSMMMAEFATCVKYGLPIKVVIIKNNSLAQIKWEQIHYNGNPEYGCDLHPIDFAAFARACGGIGFRIEDPAECGYILDEALKISLPVIIEAVVDPNEPPLPPSVTKREAKKLVKAFTRGIPAKI